MTAILRVRQDKIEKAEEGLNSSSPEVRDYFNLRTFNCVCLLIRLKPESGCTTLPENFNAYQAIRQSLLFLIVAPFFVKNDINLLRLWPPEQGAVRAR